MILGIDHIGILVDSIEKAIPMYVKLFGYTLHKTVTMESVGLTVAFLKQGQTNIELVAYTGSTDQTAFSRSVMGEYTGYNHICYAVDDLTKTLSELESVGINTIEGFPMQGGHGKIAFLNPDNTGGALIELCEPLNS
jgi:methylmalonyl-CoA/ethylmalonyl-CoA epimerase